jgi:hypothetical protein
MAGVYSDTLKTNRMTLMGDLVNSKVAAASTGGGSAGKLVIGTSSLAGATGVLATLAIPNPGFTVSTPSGGTVISTLLGVPLSVAASGSGTAAKAELRNAADAVIVGNLSVGTSAADVILNSVSITAPQTVTVSSGVITHG